MLTVYGTPRSRTTRVLWMLEETGLDYEFTLVNLLKGEGQRPPYIDLNPTGKVPTLVDGELILSESAAICAYLGDKYPESGLVPRPGTAQRAYFDQWSYFCLSELEQPLWTLAKHSFALPEAWRVTAVKDTARKEFALAVKVLAHGLDEQPYILGNSFSAADILLGHTLSWARTANLPFSSERLEAYADRVLSRPALARAREREQSATQ